MQYTKIKGLETEVSRIAFGCMSTVPSQTYGGVDDGEAVAAMRRAMDLGINFFDTARAYADGASERQLGEAVKGLRDKVVIASKPKAGDLSEGEILSECEKSLTDLGTDYIDLYQIHWPRRQVPLEETVRAMEKLVDQGKVRAIGVCNFGREDLSEWASLGPCSTNQIAYSLLVRAPEFGTLDVAEEHGIGVLCYSPLAQGLLAGVYGAADDVPDGKARTRHFRGDRPESRHGEAGCEAETFEAVAKIVSIAERVGHSPADVSLAWLLSRPAVSAVLVGASRPSQVERNVKAVSVTLDDQTLRELGEATHTVREILGESLDVWASPPRTR